MPNRVASFLACSSVNFLFPLKTREKNKTTHYSNYDSQGERAKTYKNIYVYLRCLSVFTEVLLSEVQ